MAKGPPNKVKIHTADWKNTAVETSSSFYKNAYTLIHYKNWIKKISKRGVGREERGAA